MSRLIAMFSKFLGIQGRKKARYRAYKSEALSSKMRIVNRAAAQKGKSGR